MTPEEYFKKWAENCRIFTDYKPIHDHNDMMQFAKDYHNEQLRLHDVMHTLIAWEQYKKANWYESDAIDVEKMLMEQFKAIYCA